MQSLWISSNIFNQFLHEKVVRNYIYDTPSIQSSSYHHHHHIIITIIIISSSSSSTCLFYHGVRSCHYCLPLCSLLYNIHVYPSYTQSIDLFVILSFSLLLIFTLSDTYLMMSSSFRFFTCLYHYSTSVYSPVTSLLAVVFCRITSFFMADVFRFIYTYLSNRFTHTSVSTLYSTDKYSIYAYGIY